MTSHPFFCSNLKNNSHTVTGYNMLDDPFMPYFCPCNYDKIFPFHSLSNDDFIKLWPSKIKTVNINKIHYDLTQYCTLKTIAKISQSPKDFIILQINTRSLIKKLWQNRRAFNHLKNNP